MLYILCENCGYETNYYDNLVDAIKEIKEAGGDFDSDTICPFCKLNTLIMVA